MAHVSADRVRDTSTTTGTGVFTVSGSAPNGYQTFSSVCSTNDTFWYSIGNQSANEWEVGLGTYSAANQITRTTVLRSSNAGSAVNFSAGTKDVFITLPADKTLILDNNGNARALGTPASVTLTNATGLPISSGVSGLGTGVATAAGNAVNATGGFITYSTFAPASGKTLTVSNSITIAGTDGTTMTFPSASASIGYLNVPQNSQTAAYVAVVGDVGKHISITTGGVTVNASVFSAGDVFTIYNNSSSNQTITAGTSVTFRLAGTATTGNRTLAQYGAATLLCVTGGATPTFVVSGAGVT